MWREYFGGGSVQNMLIRVNFLDGKFLVYTMTFEEFRQRQLNHFNRTARGIMCL